ncbi:alpha/beta hydrolase [Candidatus Bipolaricaulota bacterium]|nr:alpha/beta hydrolase [Candidatus Bipolaricaulota bacterium]
MSSQITQMFISEMPGGRSLLSAGRHLFLSNSQISEKRELSYGSRKRQKLDIYEPVEIDEDTETVVFIHGGGWETGNKDVHKFIGRSWAQKNFTVAIPNYRLAPDATYPDQVEDIAAAVSWLQHNYDNFTGSLYLAGHSAGAHLASLFGFSDHWRKIAELELERIRGFILLAGVYQFYPFEIADPRVRRFLGEKSYWEEAQPFNHLKKSLPPVFLAHGQEDGEVSPEQSIQLKERLAQINVSSELLLEGHVGHLELLLRTTMINGNFWSSMDKFFDDRTTDNSQVA